MNKYLDPVEPILKDVLKNRMSMINYTTFCIENDWVFPSVMERTIDNLLMDTNYDPR